MHSKTRPKISIVIAAWNDIVSLRRCLISLKDQAAETGAEVIVVSNFESGIVEAQAEYDFAKFIIRSAESTVPLLRSFGIIESTGEIIALSEDFAVFSRQWCQEVIEAHKLFDGVIGGAIENSYSEYALNWAVYFYDYGKYMPPHPNQEETSLSALNVSYKRDDLEQVQTFYLNGFHEFSLHNELKARGQKLYFSSKAFVFHDKNYDLKKTVYQFYHQARAFAAQRFAGELIFKRLMFTFGSILLPFLICIKIILRIINKKRNLGKLFFALPHLALLSLVWSFGEFCGYLKGIGVSGRKWK